MACAETLKLVFLALLICVGAALHCAPGDGSGDSVSATSPAVATG